MKLPIGLKYKTGGTILLIPCCEIVPNPNQPRKNFDSDELKNLALSIKSNGIIQPLVVKRNSEGSNYELISGERRLRAAISLGLQTVPCVLMDISENDSALFAIIENMQRDNLSFFEEADSIYKLITHFGMKQDEICKRLGKSQSYISNKLRLLKLNDDLKAKINENGLTERHARALLKLNGNEEREAALLHITEKKLNVTQTDSYIESLLTPKISKCKPKLKKLKDIKIFVNTINHAVDTMRSVGIRAVLSENETQDYLEFVVRIPKITASPVNIADYSGKAV